LKFLNTEKPVLKIDTGIESPTRPSWLVDENETIDLTMCAILKGASKERIKAEFTSFTADKYEECDQIYTDGSLKDDKVGFAVSLQTTKLLKK
jgi:hypothetical protein